MKKRTKPLFFVVVAVAILVGIFVFTGVRIPLPGNYYLSMPAMRYGIDIRGGVDAVFEPKDLDRSPTAEELDSAKAIIETRLDQQNILDRDVIIDNQSGTINVRFPWASTESDFNPQEAIAELGETARLTFRDPDGAIVVEGKDIESNSPQMNTESGGYVVQLKFNAEGTKAFAEATERLIGQRISIYMDEVLISDPTVQSHIPNGEAVITGSSTLAEAKELSDKITAGALPFSLTSRNHSVISPTLGEGALNVMINAAVLAFILICIYMVLYYRVPGLVACFALLTQIEGQLLLLALPQITLTLPGIAGIILSIGMGVDANIIIAERISEELKGGRQLDSAIMTGFKRAFSSVFDGNVTLLMVALVMYYFGSGSILSFAYTTAMGVLMNFVSGVFLTRVMTYSISQYHFVRKPALFMCLSRRIEG